MEVTISHSQQEMTTKQPLRSKPVTIKLTHSSLV